jgi:hypothetical protein
MASVAIIRPGPTHRPDLQRLIKGAGYRVVDISNWEQLDFALVGDDGRPDCLLEGIPLRAFTAVVFYGAPDTSRSDPPFQPVDQAFLQQERDQSLLTAIVGSGVRLINSGFWIDFHRMLTRPEAQLRMLSAIGWKTPSVIWDYDLSMARLEKRRAPEPERRALLVLTRRRHILIPSIVGGPDLGVLIESTQSLMSDFDLDWCVIALGSNDGETTAYGLQTELPEVLPAEVAHQLIRDAIGTHRT